MRRVALLIVGGKFSEAVAERSLGNADELHSGNVKGCFCRQDPLSFVVEFVEQADQCSTKFEAVLLAMAAGLAEVPDWAKGDVSLGLGVAREVEHRFPIVLAAEPGNRHDESDGAEG